MSDLDDWDLDESVLKMIENTTESDGLKSHSEPTLQHLSALLKYFGHKQFRPMQWEIISALMEKKQDVCAIMATGYGKSLCFQFPSNYLGGVTLVVSPLISLMEDQVLSLTVLNISACLLGSAQKNQSEIITDIFNNKYTMVYLTPEFCTGDMGDTLLTRMSSELKITLIAVDEAHCISSWGHDFRASYRRLGLLHSIFPKTPMLAVTATATPKVRQDIITNLKLKNPLIINSGFDRPNLYFEVNRKSDTFTDLRKLMVVENNKLRFSGPTIIYCITRKDTEDVAQLLKLKGFRSACYHAGLPLKTRKEAHEQFVRDKIDVVVATIAFGMGIDKPDIRTIVHYGCSKSIEGYYQEVGRAGRDGGPAKCVTFYSDNDFNTYKRMENSQNNEADHLAQMRNFLTSRSCRRDFILNYFGDSLKTKEPQLKCCDNCALKHSDQRSDHEKYENVDETGLYDFSEDARIFLGSVDVMGGSFGVGTYILFIRGSRSARINIQYHQNILHGKGKHRPDDWWKAISALLIKEGYIKETMRKNNQGFSYSVQSLTSKGEAFVRIPTKVLLPPPSTILPHLKTKSEAYTMVCINPKEQPTTSRKVSLDQSDEQRKLFRMLIEKRTEIADSLDCMPFTVASNAALMQMCKHKPKTLEEVRSLHLDGFTDVKIQKFAAKFMKVIHPNEDSSVKKSSGPLQIRMILNLTPIPNVSMNTTSQISLSLYENGLTIAEIAQQRGVQANTIMSHLCTGLKMGYPIKLSDLEVGEEVRDLIISMIKRNYSDFAEVKLMVIKEACPEEITYSQIRAVTAYLQVRQHLAYLKIPYVEFEDFPFVNVSSDDNLEQLLDLCDYEEPATKKSKVEEETITPLLESPPRQSQSERPVLAPIPSKKKVLPPWLLSRKV